MTTNLYVYHTTLYWICFQYSLVRNRKWPQSLAKAISVPPKSSFVSDLPWKKLLWCQIETIHQITYAVRFDVQSMIFSHFRPIPSWMLLARIKHQIGDYLLINLIGNYELSLFANFYWKHKCGTPGNNFLGWQQLLLCHVVYLFAQCP